MLLTFLLDCFYHRFPGINLALGDQVGIPEVIAEDNVPGDAGAARGRGARSEAGAADARRAGAARAAAAAAAASNYTSSAFVDASGRTCPVAGANTFRDSWMEPRDYRNGYHKATDMMAALADR